MSENINETILNMVKNFKSTVDNRRNSFEYTTLKRSLSSNSNLSSYDDFTPTKKMKSESKPNLSYIGSPSDIRSMRADLVEARNTIKVLEGRINHMHSVRKQVELMLEEENNTLKRQNEYDRGVIEKLENQLQTVRKREIELKDKLTEINEKYTLLKDQSSKDVEVLEKSLTEIKSETQLKESEQNRVVPSLKRKIDELETMLKAAEEDAEAHKKLAEELGKRIREDNVVATNLQLKEQELLKAKLYIKELEYAKESYGEFQEQAKSQISKLARYVELEKENEVLKEDNIRIKEQVRNKLILEEEVFNLKNRLIKYKENEKKLTELQVQETQNAMYLNEWRAVARGICESTESDSALPHQLRCVVERLQQQELALTSKKVELESQLRTTTHEAKVAKSELEKCQKLINDLKQSSEQKQKLIHRMEKRLMLVSRERDSYRLQLDSYERDLTMYMNTTTGNGSSTPNQIQSQKEHIDNLEKIVADYRDMVTKLENDLHNAEPLAHNDMIPLKAEQITRLKDQVQQLQLENERLRERRDELEIRLETFLEGQDTDNGGKIIHPNVNPLNEMLSERHEKTEKLQQEVHKLKKKIKNLEEGIETSKLGDVTINPQEVNNLKEQLKSQESQVQKLKDYFKSQMQEFRNVIYMLLGYKIDRQNSLYKLKSMYAEQQEDLLCFQFSNDGDLNLLENDYTSTVENMIDLHLRHQKSIPVFLSALTMDLFNNRTMTHTFETE